MKQPARHPRAVVPLVWALTLPALPAFASDPPKVPVKSAYAGAYVEEIASAPKAMPGVSTAVPAGTTHRAQVVRPLEFPSLPRPAASAPCSRTSDPRQRCKEVR